MDQTPRPDESRDDHQDHQRDLDAEFAALMGPSGSGKSTLMNIIGCMDSATSGEVILDGEVLTDATPEELTRYRRDKIGIVFQQFHMIPYLTAVENIMVAQYYHSMPDRDEAMAALERVGLADRASHLPSQLSGGEQQRVAIARAMVNRPKLLMADEPTGNLDPSTSVGIMRLLDRINRQGTTVVMATHDDEIVDQMRKRVIELKAGEVVRDQARGVYGSDR